MPQPHTETHVDLSQCLAYRQVDLMALAAVSITSLQQMPREQAVPILQKIYNPGRVPVVDTDALADYIADRIDSLSRLSEKYPPTPEQMAVSSMDAGEKAFEEILNDDPQDVAVRLLTYPATEEILGALYRELTEI